MIYRLFMTVTIFMATFLATAVHAADLPSRTHHDVVKTDSPSASVYPKQLVAYDDKPLSELAREGNELIYRFSCFPSFAPPLIVRLHVNEAGDGIVILNRWGGRRALDHRQYLREGTQYEVSAPEVSKFLALVKSTDFWNMPLTLDSFPGYDGSTWILEGIRNGAYHVVSRWSPEPGDFRGAGLLLMNYAGLDRCGAHSHLGQYKLHKLEFVGLIVSGNPPATLFAIVKTPEGDLVRARTGSFMGTAFGKVVAITEDFIQITEIIPDGQGGWMERENRLYRSDSQSQRNYLGK